MAGALALVVMYIGLVGMTILMLREAIKIHWLVLVLTLPVVYATVMVGVEIVYPIVKVVLE